jgi:two-component system chemotaxis response regulator CheB
MTINVLLADKSEIVRKVIADLLKSDLEIQVLAEAASLSQTLQLLSNFHPHIVVMDIHIGDERTVKPSMVKLCFVDSPLLANSLWKDEETKALADSYGAVRLLDKTQLAYELIPAIKRCE